MITTNVWATAAIALAAGCTGPQQLSRSQERVVARYISGLTGCSPEEIAVREFHRGWGANTWTAECAGQTFRCTASAVDVACAPATRRMPRASLDSTARRPAEVRSSHASAPVRRVRSAEGNDWLLVALVSTGIYDIEIVARPGRYRNALQMTVSAPASVSEHCGVDTIADGAVVRHDATVQRRAGRTAFRTIVDIERVRAFAEAASAAGRVCDGEWRFDTEAQRTLRELLRRIDDEAAFTRVRQL